MTAREYTTEEVRDMFLNHVASLVKYWDARSTTSREKLEGLAHSLLATIDGCDGIMPAFILAPAPHPADRQFLSEQEDDYFPENADSDLFVNANISGGLHELIHRYCHGR